MLFFLDYYEGVLPEAQREELMRFLDEHPDLKVEFYDFEMVELPKDNRVKYRDKDDLKKDVGVFDNDDDGKDVPPLKISLRDSEMAVEVNDDNYESLFVAYVEGDLHAADAAAVESFAASDEKYGRELRLMQMIKVQPDKQIQYPGKAAMKRHFIGVPQKRKWQYTSAAAAVLLLATLVYSLFPVFETTYIAEEIPVVGDQDAPEAVAATPVPRQDAPPLIAEAKEVISRADAGELVSQTPSLQRPRAEYTRSYIGGPIALDLTTLRGTTDRPASEPPAPMPERPAGRLVAQADARPPAPEHREEVFWLTYQDPQDLPAIAMKTQDLPKTSEVGLGSFVLSRIGERTGVDRLLADAAEDGNPLREMANEGISRIAPASSNLLGIETIRDESGRLVRLAIGDGFAITRR